MEIVYLLVAFVITAVIGILVYLGVAYITRRIKKDVKKDLIKRAICNRDEACDCCSANCDKFIEEVIAGVKSLEECPKISSEDKDELKQLLAIKPEIKGEKVAHVMCKGGARSVDQFGYVGARSCAYSNQMFEGLKKCQFGCQGCMDCAKVCPTGAIKKNKAGVAEIDRSLCIACGECVKACPDKLIELIDINEEVVLSCMQARNPKTGEEVHKFCSVGCTKCGECVKVCPTGALKEENGTIKFNKEKCIKCAKCVNACPNSTITNINSDFFNF